MPAKVSIDYGNLFKNIESVRESVNSLEMKRVAFEAATIARDRAKALAPYDEKREKGTHLRDAIVIGPGPRHFPDVLLTVRYKRPGAPHSHLIEFGTVRMAARPFLRPAIAATKAQMAEKLKQGGLEVIKKSVQ